MHFNQLFQCIKIRKIIPGAEELIISKLGFDIKELALLLHHHPEIMYLTIDKLRPDPALIHVLCTGYLRTLHLDRCQLGDHGATIIANALGHTRLIWLDLSENQIGDKGAVALGNALSYDNSRLKNLILFYNQIGWIGATALANALLSNTHLIYLNLTSNQIGTEGAEAFADTLPYNTHLKHLVLSDNQRGEAGSIALATAIQHNHNIELILATNQISDTGVITLAHALQYHIPLTQLGIGAENVSIVSDRAMTIFARALRNNNSLIYLHLLFPITDQVAFALADALQKNNHLKQLHVMTISDSGINAIAATQIKNTSLTYLWIEDTRANNPIMLQRISNICNKNSKIREMIAFIGSTYEHMPKELIKHILQYVFENQNEKTVSRFVAQAYSGFDKKIKIKKMIAFIGSTYECIPKELIKHILQYVFENQNEKTVLRFVAQAYSGFDKIKSNRNSFFAQIESSQPRNESTYPSIHASTNMMRK